MNFEDPEFPQRVRSQDPVAIHAVVEAYLPHVVNTARASGLDAARSEDVAQETFRTFIERAASFEGRSHVRTWLFGILYRKIAEARRGLQRERLSDDIDSVVENRFNPNGGWRQPPQLIQVYGAEVSQLIEHCLEGLPTAQRMAFVLREKEEMNTEEICKILDVSRTYLGVLLYRSRNHLRECLERKGVS